MFFAECDCYGVADFGSHRGDDAGARERHVFAGSAQCADRVSCGRRLVPRADWREVRTVSHRALGFCHTGGALRRLSRLGADRVGGSCFPAWRYRDK